MKNIKIDLKGKRGIVMGIANERSVAWGISESLSKSGAELAFSYAGDALKKRVVPLALNCGSKIVYECDVSSDNSIKSFFNKISKEWESIDFLVHSIAFSDKNELKGDYLETTRNNFINTLDISCYSFTIICREASKLMKNGGQLLTLSYLGAERVMPHYNVMGVAKAALECSVKYLATDLGKKNIRVNAISAGPIRTLAASGIKGFRKMLDYNANTAPLKRNVTIEDVGNSAVFLCSDLSSGVTGEILHVDCGYSTVGVPPME